MNAASGPQATAQIAAIEDVQSRYPDQLGDQLEASDGPGVRVTSPADLEAIADENEARETRWREGA